MNQADLRDIVTETLTKIVPLGSPPCFKDVLSVSTKGSGRRLAIIADLTLFDGEHATVRLEQFSMGGFPGWSVGWDRLDGGAFYLSGDEWRRAGPAYAQAAA